MTLPRCAPFGFSCNGAPGKALRPPVRDARLACRFSSYMSVTNPRKLDPAPSTLLAAPQRLLAGNQTLEFGPSPLLTNLHAAGNRPCKVRPGMYTPATNP